MTRNGPGTLLGHRVDFCLSRSRAPSRFRLRSLGKTSLWVAAFAFAQWHGPTMLLLERPIHLSPRKSALKRSLCRLHRSPLHVEEGASWTGHSSRSMWKELTTPFAFAFEKWSWMKRVLKTLARRSPA